MYSMRATRLCLLLYVHLMSNARRKVKIIKYLRCDFLYSPALFNQYVSKQLANFIFVYFYAFKVSVSCVVAWRESWVRIFGAVSDRAF